MKRVLFVASTGGHLNELLRLNELFQYYDYQIITEGGPSTKHLKDKYPSRVHYLLFGSKEHLFSYLFKFAFNILISLYYAIRFRPQVMYLLGHILLYRFAILGSYLALRLSILRPSQMFIMGI